MSFFMVLKNLVSTLPHAQPFLTPLVRSFCNISLSPKLQMPFFVSHVPNAPAARMNRRLYGATDRVSTQPHTQPFFNPPCALFLLLFFVSQVANALLPLSCTKRC
jgi:hypothetical protein